jgi:hypothetical protein
VTPRRLGVVLAVLAVGAAALAVGRTGAAFSSVRGNAGSSYAVAPDFVAPSVVRTRVADPANAPSYAVRQCRFYQVYAEVADTGNPPSGVASVVADLSALTGGVHAESLVSGSYTLDGVSYGWRSLPRLATAGPGAYFFSLTATDDAGNGREEGGLDATVAAAPGAIGTVFLTGLEQGVASSAAPGVFTAVTGAGVSADAAGPRHGAYSLRVAPANAAAHATAALSGSGDTAVVRFAVRLASLPGTSVNLFSVGPGDGAAVSTAGFLYDAASGRFAVRWGAGGSIVTGTVAPTAGTWYVIDLRATTASPHVLEWRIDGADQPAASTSQVAQTITSIDFGTEVTNVTYTANFDDVIVSRTPTDYPIGNGKVLSLAPDGMGTHSGPNRFRHDDNSNINAGSWMRVDDVPADSASDYVKQTTGDPRRYLEFNFADTAESCINAVGARLVYHAAAAGPNDGSTYIYSGGTQTVVHSGDMGLATLGYANAVVSSGSSAWTPALLNALVARVGFSGDVNPNPYWDALLLEYDVPISW